MAGLEPVAGRKRAHPSWLYARLLSGTWSALPQPIQQMHALDDRLAVAGRASIERGGGTVARLVAAMARFPPAAEDVEVRVDFERRGNVEIWRRNFGGHLFPSTQETGPARTLVERFGPAAFAMVLAWDGRRLNLRLRSWRLLGLPMPAWSAPVTTAWETVEDDRFRFFVEIGHPWTGLIVRYQGWLAPV